MSDSEYPDFPESERSADDLSALSGSLLLAHPNLGDPNFSQSVILLSAHSSDGGALGVILNRPCGKTLGEMFPEHGLDSIGSVEVFLGGPVQQEQLILAAWKWDEAGKIFKMFFGITRERAEELLNSEENVTIRGFLGYAGWSAGQLEAELTVDSWIPQPITFAVFDRPHDAELWTELMVAVSGDQALSEVAGGSDPLSALPDPPDHVEWN